NGSERSYATVGVVALVTSKLYQRQLPVPAILPVQTACSEHVLQSLDRPLGLAVRLRMKGRTQLHLSTKRLLDTLPNPGSESGIPIRDDGYRNTMKSHNAVHIQPSQLLHRLS